MLSIVDDYTRVATVYLLERKSESEKYIKEFVK